MNVTCPRCQMENAYFDGVVYFCPDCDYEWTDSSVTIDEEDDDEDFDEEENEDDDINQSEIYANHTISELLKKVIKNFDKYQIDSKDLPVISTIYMVVTDYENYDVNSYLYFTIKEIDQDDNLSYMEILIDQDGLSLTKGGYIKSEIGGDTYSKIVYEHGDEDNLILTQGAVDEFVEEFQKMLMSPTKEFDIFDSGDGIEETE